MEYKNTLGDKDYCVPYKHSCTELQGLKMKEWTKGRDVRDQIRQDCYAVGQMINEDWAEKNKGGKRKIWAKKRK